MKKWPRYPWILVLLGGVALTTPIASAYMLSLQLILWLLITGRWGTALRRSVHAVDDAPGIDDAALARARGILRPLTLGVIALVASVIVSQLVSWILSPYVTGFAGVLNVMHHFSLKLGLMWFIWSSTLFWLWRRGWKPASLGPWLAAWLAVNLVYCLAQRATGIDWTHGFGAVLGPHRQAYGVYRISGFMGHPLTLAYNLVMIALAASAMLWREGTALSQLERRSWWAVLGLACVTLLASGSRFPLAVLGAVWIACEWRRAWRYRLWISGVIILAAAALWMEGSMVGRVRELFDSSIPLTSRFDRVIFWQVHLRMFLDHPLAGVGVSGLDEAYRHYYTGIPVRDNVTSAHNLYLQILADSGLIGFFGLAAFLAGFGWTARRHGGARGSAYLLGGVVVSALMQNNLRDSEFLFALWLLVATTALTAARTPDERKPPQNLEPPANRAHPAPYLPG